MANTLTNLIPTIYQSLDIVSRELVGFIPAVTLNAGAEQAAKDQTITFPVSGARTAADIAAAATGPDPADSTVGNDSLSISKSRGVTFYFTGEEQMGLGGMYQKLLQNEFAQAMRTLTNEVETDLAALYALASRAYGAAGTIPFGTAADFSDAAQALKILKDNGAGGEFNLVINTAAGANIRGKQASAYMQGGDSLLRQGVLADIHGFAIRESAQVKTVTAVGTNTGTYAANGAHAVGATSITLKTGTGTILAGDIIYFGTDTANKYVVKTGIAAAGACVINAPGLRVALAGDEAVTVIAAGARNMAFTRDAINLVTRVPAMPEGGDAADDVIVVTDALSGISFQIAMYRQRRRIAYEVGLAWGVKANKSANIALLYS